MYDTILVAHDNSEPSKAALAEACKWVKRHGGRIIMVRAVYFDEEEFVISPEQREKRFETGKNACAVSRQEISAEFGIEAESVVCEGEAVNVIIETAREKKADMIAMGTHGRKGLSRLLMGSVTSGVIVNSRADILVTKKSSGGSGGSYSSILVPFDGSDFSKKALERACSFAKADGGEITILYVIPRYEEMIGFFKSDSIRRGLMDEAEKILNLSREVAAAQGVAVKMEICEGGASEEITQTASRLGNDLIVMGTYGWRGVNKAIMGSTTERVLINAPCPVLAVR